MEDFGTQSIPVLHTLKKATSFLSICHRQEIRNPFFEDIEIYWTTGDLVVAAGYFAKGISGVSVIGGTRYTNAEAFTLREVGILYSLEEGSFDDENSVRQGSREFQEEIEQEPAERKGAARKTS